MSIAVSIHGKTYRRRGIQELSQPGYVRDIVHPLERFDEKMTPLSRGYVPPGGWEKEFLDTLVPAMGRQGVVPRDESGYTQIDLALRIAGFHNAMATNCHTGNWTRPRLSDELGCFYDNVCPFNKRPGIGHDLVRWFVRKKIPRVSQLLKWGDDLFYKIIYKTGKYAPKT